MKKMALVFFAAVAIWPVQNSFSADDVSVKTVGYYPSPEGDYQKLRTTDQTLLATDSASSTAQVGIGTQTPGSDVKLDVAGKTRVTGLQIADGTEGYNKVLVSDEHGNTRWATLSTGGSATQTYDLKVTPVPGAWFLNSDTRYYNDFHTAQKICDSFENQTVVRTWGVTLVQLGHSNIKTRFWDVRGNRWMETAIGLPTHDHIEFITCSDSGSESISIT
ncbi:MAG: hypothetical protein HYT89_01645 [Candidatus Omnitrophica bacterium]|nr:hypothetical protein [Candidatus Omnitrophota bacterium]